MGLPSANAAIWNVNADGNWSDAGNWSGTLPDGVGATASLTYNIYTGTGVGPKTVTLDTTSRTVGTLNIGDSGSAYLGYTLAASGGAALILDNALANAQIHKISTATAAADTISAALVLNSSLDISNNAPAGLTLSGGVSAYTAGLKTLTNKGAGGNAVELSGSLGDGSGQIAVTQNSASSVLILSGTNTYSGDTIVSIGTLQLGNGGTSGSLSLSSAITNNGTLVFNRSDILTQGIDFNSVIGGNGAVTQAGTGTTLLNGTNTFLGTVTLSAGMLSVSADTHLGAANPLVFNGGTLQVTGTAMTGFGSHTPSFTSTKAVALEINDAANTFTVSQVLNQGSGGLVKSGAGTLSLTNTNSYTGLTTVSAGTLAYGITNALNSGAVTVNGGTLDVSSFSDSVGVVTLTNGAITGTTGVLTGSSYVFNGTGTISAILAGTGSITKSGAATTTTLSGLNTFTGVTTLSSGLLSVATIGFGGVAGNLGAAAVAAANLVFNGGTLQYTGATASTNRGFTINASNEAVIEVSTLTSNLTISGAGAATTGALTKTGAGTLTLSGANSFTGLTLVSEGTLAYGVTNALSNGAVTIDGGTLDIAGFTDTVGAVTLTSGSITGTTGVLTGTGYALDGSGTVAATLGGASATLTKSNAGIATLGKANSYGGLTTVSGGTLAYGIDNALNGGGITVNGGILDISSFTDTVGAVILSSGSITGSTGILSGTSYALTGTGSISAMLGGSAALTKTNAGSVTLTGTNTYNGLTTVSGGTLTYGIENALGSGAVTISGGILDIASFNDAVGVVTLSAGSITGTTGVLSGTSYALSGTGNIPAILGGEGSLTKTGAGTVTTLSGSNTYSGITTLTSGTLAISAIDALGTATPAAANLVFNGGTLQFTGASASTERNFTLTAATTGTIEVTTGNLTISGASAATSGALIKAGAGTLTLAGTNNHTGLTTVSGGTLAYGIDNALGSGAVTVNGGTLDISSYNDAVGAVTLSAGSVTGTTGVLSGTSYALTGSGSISAILGGAGTLTKSGAATVTTLSGSNTYSGATSISAGTLKLGTEGTATHSPLGTTAAGTTVTAGASLDLNGFTLGTTEALTLNGTGVDSLGALTNSSTKAATYSGLLTLGSSSRIGATSGDIILSNTGTIAGAYDLRLEGGATGSSIASVIGIGGTTLYKSGAGTWTLSGANTYTSITRIEAGTLKLGAAGNGTQSPLGTIAGATGTQIGGALDLNGISLSTAELLTLRGSGVNSGGALTNSDAAAATYKGALTMEAGVSIVASGGDIILSSPTAVAGGAVQLTVGGAKNTTLSSNYGPNNGSTLTKVGAGTLTLTAANTYAGATTISEGTLSVGTTGSINGTNSISIGAGTLNYNSTTPLSQGVAFSSAGGTLSGTGKITPLVNVTAGNTLAPGNSIGTLGLGTGLTLAGTYAAQLGTPGTTPATGISDLAAVTGNLVLTSGTLNLSDNAGTNELGSAAVGAYRLLSFTGTRTGEFASVSNPLSASLHESVVYNGTSNGTVDLNLYRLAAINTLATPVTLGVVRVGGTFGTSAVSIHNTAAADGFSEGLDASGSATTGNATTSGSVTNLAANATNNTSLLVGLGDTGTAGAKSGTVTVSLASNGSGTSGYGTTALTSQEVAVSGGVFDFAQANYTGTTLAFGNVHQGATVSAQTVAIGNQTVSDAAYQDLLDVAGETDNAKVTASGFNALAASTAGANTGNLSIGVITTSVGSLASTASLTLTSNHNNLSGLSDGTAALVGTPGAITTTGLVYSGQMVWNGNSAAAWNGDANWNDSQDASVHAAPGLDAEFAAVDSATLGNSTGPVTVNLDGAAPSVHALTFNNTGSYTIAQGTGTTGITLAGTGTSITVTGTHSITAPMTLASNTNITVTASGDSLTLSGEISGSGLTKTGGGTLVLTGANTYCGPTTLSGGTLLVNNLTGSGTGSGALDSAANTTLGGSGTLGGTTTIAGIHTPGDGTGIMNGAGIMTFASGLAYAASATLQWQLTDNLTTGRGSIFDGVNVTGGAFSIASGATIDLSFASAVDFSKSFWNSTQTWTVVDLFTGVTASDTDVLTLGNTYLGAEGAFSVTRDAAADNDVVLTWTATVTETPYEAWAKTNISEKDQFADATPGGDPDHDGVTNSTEFAFSGDPLSGTDKGLIFGLKADANNDGKRELILTVAVRKSAVFNGATTSDPAEGIRYAIEGSASLTGFAAATVTLVAQADTILPGVPLADSTNYEYRSFYLTGSSGLSGNGFLRAAVIAE